MILWAIFRAGCLGSTDWSRIGRPGSRSERYSLMDVHGAEGWGETPRKNGSQFCFLDPWQMWRLPWMMEPSVPTSHYWSVAASGWPPCSGGPLWKAPTVRYVPRNPRMWKQPDTSLLTALWNRPSGCASGWSHTCCVRSRRLLVTIEWDHEVLRMQAHTSLKSHDWTCFLYKHQQGRQGTIKIKDKNLPSLREVKRSSVNGEPALSLTRQETLPNPVARPQACHPQLDECS